MARKPKSSNFSDAAMHQALFPAFDAVQARLGTRIAVEKIALSLADVFSVAFVRLFLTDCPNYQQPDGTYGASRSNWTYHTALAMAQAAKLLDWTCKFETHGKRDAIMQTKDDPPITMLVAEWEWDTEDIFGKAKELDKLRTTCRDHQEAAAFLLTYCTEERYPGYLERVVDEWCLPARGRRTTTQLFLHSIIYSERGAFREFEKVRTALVEDKRLELWCDEVFDNG